MIPFLNPSFLGDILHLLYKGALSLQAFIWSLKFNELSFASHWDAMATAGCSLPLFSLCLFLLLISVGVSTCLFVYVQQSRVGTQKDQNHNVSSPLCSSFLILPNLFSSSLLSAPLLSLRTFVLLWPLTQAVNSRGGRGTKASSCLQLKQFDCIGGGERTMPQKHLSDRCAPKTHTGGYQHYIHTLTTKY